MSAERFGFLQAAIGYMTLLVVLSSSLMLGANRPASWMFLAFVVLFLFGFQLIYGLMTPSPVPARRTLWPAVIFLCVVVWAGVQTLGGMPAGVAHPFWAFVPDGARSISADPGQGMHGILRYLCYGMVFMIAVHAASSPVTAARMLRGIAVFSTLLAIYGFYAFATGNNPILEQAATSGLVQASFVNRNNYATYAVFGALANVAAYLHVTQGPRGGRDGWLARLRDLLEGFYGGAWLYAFGVILCVGAVSLSQSRGGALAGLVGLFVFARVWQGRNRNKDWLLAAVLIGLVVFVAFTSATGLAQRLLASGDEEGRFIVFPAIVAGIADRPILGHGLGAFHDAFRPYLPAEGATGEWIRAHNSYLENAFELGLPAALALYAALFIILRRLWRGAHHRHRHRVFSTFAIACVAVAAVHSLFDFSLQMPATAALFAMILGMGFAQSFREDELTFSKRRSGSRRHSKRNKTV